VQRLPDQADDARVHLVLFSVWKEIASLMFTLGAERMTAKDLS